MKLMLPIYIYIYIFVEIKSQFYCFASFLWQKKICNIWTDRSKKSRNFKSLKVNYQNSNFFQEKNIMLENGATTFSITIFSITTFSTTTLSIVRLSIMTLRIMTLSIKGL